MGGVPDEEKRPRTRGRGAKTPQRRAAIARAVLEVVQERGHRSLTLAEVAARAGISERAMLHHFPTRDHLLVAALELADADDRSTFKADHDQADEDVTIDDIAGSFALAAMRNDHVIRLRAAMGTAATDPHHPAHEYFAGHARRGRVGLARMVRLMQASEQAHPDLDPEETALLLQSVWQGLEGAWLVAPDFDLADALTVAFRRLVGQPLMEQRALVARLAATV